MSFKDANNLQNVDDALSKKRRSAAGRLKLLHRKYRSESANRYQMKTEASSAALQSN